MRTSRPLSLLFVLALVGPVAAQPADAPPSTPADLVATTYSRTAGAIGWSRSTDDRGVVVGYEVSRQGVVLGVFDALSYVDISLSPGTAYLYRVTAIDTAGQRSGTSSVRLTTPGGVSGGGPAAPTGLRADVYSRTAAEIFWDRSTAPGLTYEVRRDGAALTVRNGTSYFDDALERDRSYAYEVIAIDARGRRSMASRVTLDTLPGVGIGDPVAPRGLRGAVYSATAVEIFWERPASSGLTYDVLRDGERLARIDGLSYFDDTLARGRSYTYTVIARDGEGRRSAPSVLSLTTSGGATAGGPPDGGGDPFAEPDAEGSTAIARLGYPAARDLADDLVSTGYLTLYYDIDVALLDFLLNREEGASNEIVTTACPGGGSARGPRGSFFHVEVEFDGCTIEGRTLSGGYVHKSVFRDSPALSSNANATVIFDELSIDAGSGGRLLVSGTSERRNLMSPVNPLCDGAPTVYDRIENRIETARVEGADGVSLVTDASWRQTVESVPVQTGVPFRDPCLEQSRTTSFEGEASVVSARFGSDGATLEKRGDLVRETREGVPSEVDARLAASFGDGSTLAVTSTPGVDGEVQVDIAADGAAVSFTDAYRFESRDDLPTLR